MNSVYDLAAFIKQGQSQHGLFYIPPPNGPIFATHCESTPHKMEIHHVRTPWNGGYWERIVRMVRESLRRARPCLMKKRTKLKPRTLKGMFTRLVSKLRLMEPASESDGLRP
ncbi:hypothetical protein T4D_1628 [Trichinella pseudospiralis]|uniref:Uncharacterized protein n=1 Tax=Trichinella pseudospiralis TaxID=6337 RepID=A0A0V1FF10_TRIPS|nr:hypothetical protein T4D_1628 [Trichinella pseudospiralis]